MEREKGGELSHLRAITARSRSPPRSACGLSSEEEEVAFCWAVEAAVARKQEYKEAIMLLVSSEKHLFLLMWLLFVFLGSYLTWQWEVSLNTYDGN